MDKMEDPLECPGCGRNFGYSRVPKLLQCGHVFCSACVPGLNRNAESPMSPIFQSKEAQVYFGTAEKDTKSSNDIFCPSCEAYTVINVLPEADSLPNHYGLLSASTQLGPVISPRHTFEGICVECKVFARKATAQCITCKKRLCELHKTIHGDKNGHEMRALRRNSALRLSVAIKCSDHDLEVTQYCYDCSKCICNSCATSSHEEHQFDSISIAFNRSKDEIQADSLTVHDSLLVTVCESVDASNRIIQDINANAAQVNQEIELYFDLLKQALEDRKHSLQTELESITGKKINKYKLQMNSLLHLASAMNASCTLADSSIQRLEKPSVLAVRHELKHALSLPRIATIEATSTKAMLSRELNQDISRISSFGSLSLVKIDSDGISNRSLSLDLDDRLKFDDSVTFVVDIKHLQGPLVEPDLLDVHLSLRHGEVNSEQMFVPIQEGKGVEGSRTYSLKPVKSPRRGKSSKAESEQEEQSYDGLVACPGLVVIGGMTNHSTNSIGFEAYSLSDQRWNKMTHLPTGRCGVACVSVDGILFAIGGDSGANTYSRVVERYDGKWRRSALLPTGRSGLSCVAVRDQIFAIGGTSDSKNACCDIIEQYDSSNNSWTSGTRMTQPRYYHASCVVDNSIIVLGGSGIRDEILSSVEQFDLNEGRWTSLAPLPIERRALSCVCDDHVILVTGGRDVNDFCMPDVDRMDLREGKWCAVMSDNSMTGRCAHGSLLRNNTLFSMGGCTDTTDWSASMESLDLRSEGGGWLRLPDMKAGRCDFGYAAV